MEAFARLMKVDVARVDVTEFVAVLRQGIPCIDMRSPSEFAKGHIPGAASLPLFDDEERAKVGSCFSEMGSTEAMRLGMAFVRPRLNSIVEHAQQLTRKQTSCSGDRRILVYCARGGMRSASVGWLLRNHGDLEPVLLRGGYKAFRSWTPAIYRFLPEGCSYRAISRNSSEVKNGVAPEPCADELEWGRIYSRHGPKIAIIGGHTGCGKTQVLHALQLHFSKQVLDLEGLAHHRGSAFGWCGHSKQPTQQQYENDVAVRWAALDPDQWVFVENEGRHIGRMNTPLGLYWRMREAPVFVWLSVPMHVRVRVLLEEYASQKVRDGTPNWLDAMLQSVSILRKRLGEQKTEELKGFLCQGNYEGFARAMLLYYDIRYEKQKQSVEHLGAGIRRVLEVEVPEHHGRLDAVDVAGRILAKMENSEAISS
eukprot:gnl/TRDRNA2_/TRDRNA2_129361_c0_seq1.p1 gnl/TRDRNA2_/TRDRNA2_129361_c0~~gnl/TRDRNA2_/TRDRNA2_129361_c0_seq1.p1  ORF type:complete len:424 (-),score=34.05 gnl/TRDRNA2_/TRDRNA2_129361_c0_seq1:217-1488(-)